MDTTLAQKAIELALKGEWKEALQLNLQIINESPEDIDALNRVARCYSEMGDVGKAKNTAQKVLKVDPLNTIAQKCFDRWSMAGAPNKHSLNIASPESFLEESGKTKIASLMHLGDAKIFASLDSGDEVKLMPHAHRVSVETPDGRYLGRLHDDLAARLRNLLKYGNKYQVLLKTIRPPKEVTVFIRELEKGLKAKDITSFPTEKIEYISFTAPELVHKDKNVMEFQEEVIEEN